MNKMKIGFFGGCFNPPTIAHIELAKLAIKKAKLDKIIFIPMGNCYPKDNLLDVKHRYKMLEIAIKNEKNIEVSNMQFNQHFISYAIDSFRIIDSQYECEKYFVMGEDNFKEIERWKSPKELKKHNFIVFERNGKLKEKEDIIFIETKEFNDISSTRNKRKNKK